MEVQNVNGDISLSTELSFKYHKPTSASILLFCRLLSLLVNDNKAWVAIYLSRPWLDQRHIYTDKNIVLFWACVSGQTQIIHLISGSFKQVAFQRMVGNLITFSSLMYKWVCTFVEKMGGKKATKTGQVRPDSVIIMVTTTITVGNHACSSETNRTKHWTQLSGTAV